MFIYKVWDLRRDDDIYFGILAYDSVQSGTNLPDMWRHNSEDDDRSIDWSATPRAPSAEVLIVQLHHGLRPIKYWLISHTTDSVRLSTDGSATPRAPSA
jgi:hypothetical protein